FSRWSVQQPADRELRVKSQLNRGSSKSVLVVGFGAALSVLDASMVNVALNSAAHDLKSSIASVQWLLTANLLAFATMIPASGWIARRFGPRRVYIGSLLLFIAGALLCALANTPGQLFACRVLQGAAGGIIQPTSQLIAAELASPAGMGRAMSRVWA